MDGLGTVHYSPGTSGRKCIPRFQVPLIDDLDISGVGEDTET
jgi:hypothetical protein